MKQVIAISILIFFIPVAALAEGPFTVHKAGEAFTPTVDLHCINNKNALKLISEVKLCKKECEVLLQEAERLKIVEIDTLTAQLLSRTIAYQKIILAKDEVISDFKSAIVEELDDSSSDWWKITLAVVGGVLVGAASTAVVVSLTK